MHIYYNVYIMYMYIYYVYVYYYVYILLYLPNPGIEVRSPALQVDSLPAELPGKPL